MNRHITKNGVTIHEYTKPRYNLYQMYLDAKDRSPELTILEAWYNGEFGEITAVNKLKRLGLIGEDTFREVNLNNMPIMPGYKRTPSQWTTNTIKER